MEILSASPPNFSNYILYSDGKLFSKKRNRFMKPHKNSLEYSNVVLTDDNQRKCCKGLHRLLGETFIPNPDNKNEIDHIDRDRTNNNLNNLRWATRQENNLNKNIYKSNKSGYRSIYQIGSGKGKGAWRYKRIINGKYYSKQSQDIQQCIDYKNIVEKGLEFYN